MVFLIHTELRCTVNHTSDLCRITLIAFPISQSINHGWGNTRFIYCYCNTSTPTSCHSCCTVPLECRPNQWLWQYRYHTLLHAWLHHPLERGTSILVDGSAYWYWHRRMGTFFKQKARARAYIQRSTARWKPRWIFSRLYFYHRVLNSPKKPPEHNFKIYEFNNAPTHISTSKNLSSWGWTSF